MYQQTKAEYIPLSENKTFKPLKNIIIREALNICYDEISFDDSNNDESNESESNSTKERRSRTAVIAVLNDLSKLFKKEFDNKYKLTRHIDRKALQKINEKKQAMGLKIKY